MPTLPAIAQTHVSLGFTHSIVKRVRTSLGTPGTEWIPD